MTGGALLTFRKLAYEEKVFAALLVCGSHIRSRLEARLQQLGRKPSRSTRPAVVLLEGLHALLYCFIPAIFRIGCLVRNCTWEARDNNTAHHAHAVLQRCFVMLVHLRANPEKVEYIRTLAVALLMWRSWDDELPGCMFIEESCEAMLSRTAHRCRQHQHLWEFDDVFDLFVTTPNPRMAVKERAGGVRDELAHLFISRQGLISYMYTGYG